MVPGSQIPEFRIVSSCPQKILGLIIGLSENE